MSTGGRIQPSRCDRRALGLVRRLRPPRGSRRARRRSRAPRAPGQIRLASPGCPGCARAHRRRKDPPQRATRLARRHAGDPLRAAPADRALAALVPKPRINLLLYHGVLGPSAPLRSDAVAVARALVPRDATLDISPGKDRASDPAPLDEPGPAPLRRVVRTRAALRMTPPAGRPAAVRLVQRLGLTRRGRSFYGARSKSTFWRAPSAAGGCVFSLPSRIHGQGDPLSSRYRYQCPRPAVARRRRSRPPGSSTSAPVESQPSEAQARASVDCLCLVDQRSLAGGLPRAPGGRRGRGAGGRRRADAVILVDRFLMRAVKMGPLVGSAASDTEPLR
jgi:hypothetical protein